MFLKNVPRLSSTTRYLLSISSILSCAASVWAAPQPAIVDINTLEKRFFSRVYNVDPLDKRLQRLECMLFGSSQEGSLGDRMARIQRAIADKSHSGVASSSPKGTDAKQLAEISNLEKKMLKKSYPAESAAQRLARLEMKVLGQPSNAMSASDRIDRLKKIAGVTDAPQISQFPENGGFGEYTIQSPFFGYNSPFGSSQRGAPEMDAMIKDLNRNLRNLHRMPMPNMDGQDSAPSIRRIPRHTMQRPDNGLPPYLDPNSI